MSTTRRAVPRVGLRGPRRALALVCLAAALDFAGVAALGAHSAAAQSAAPPAQAGPAAAALEQFEQSAALRGARLGVLVVDLATGETLLAKESDEPLVPASSHKLLLASTALTRWGPAHRFETPVLVEAPLSPAGVLSGRLWLAGRGDPSLVSESLWKLAEELRLRGVREIQGGLGVDASYFDGVQIHPDWEPASARAYHAPISAFAANFSSFRIEVTPGAQLEAPVQVAVAPATRYFRVDSRATTVARGGSLQLDVAQLADGSSERVAVAGSLAASSHANTYWRCVSSPELYAASVLRMQLEAQGIRVLGSTALGATPASAAELLRFEGEPLALVIRLMNKYSNNFIAEQLTKGLGADSGGAPGSWEKGTAAIRAHLEQLGLLDGGAVIADGSGLSPRNRVTPHMLVGVIQHALKHAAWGPEFLASLPLSGRDGTLEERLAEAADGVRGKTGHLRGVASLAGVITARDERRLVFAVLVNGARGEPPEVDRAIDRFVSALREPVAAAPLP